LCFCSLKKKKRHTKVHKRPSLPEITYKITVNTSDIKMAGTDANVFIQIFGKEVDTGKVLLKNSKLHKNKFERAQTDEFEIRAVDVRKIEKIK
jgi:lipoxygenase homology domain-containing protein 1